MKKNYILPFICFLAGMPMSACNQHDTVVNNIYHYTPPEYDSIQVIGLSDTIHFPVNENTYTDIGSFNLFYENNKPFISFYDQRSQSISIFSFTEQTLLKNITLKRILKGQDIYKTSVFIKNLDSLFIINNKTIGLYDYKGKKKNIIDFDNDSENGRAVLGNNRPLVLHQTKAYTIVRSSVNAKSTNALKKWKVMYEFDLVNDKFKLHYHLPTIYQKNLYGYHFLDYNYCYNNRGNFVFSFAADTAIYESNLHDYYCAYFSRSQFQQENIQPVKKEALENDEGIKEYATSYSYGSIFFDPFRKYYLRFVKHKISEKEFLSKSKKRRETVLILNENFRIIGESDWIAGVDFDSIIFTNDGQLYARTNFRDENALHFVRLAYQQNTSAAGQLSPK